MIGGLLGVAMSATGIGWQPKLLVVVLPAIAVATLCIGVRFPPTERAAAGVSVAEMFRELRNPLFIVLFLSMFLTAASELAPGQWVDFALSRTVHMPGILLLVYVSALDVRDAPLCGSPRPQVVVDWAAVVFLSHGVARPSLIECREFAVDGSAGGDRVGDGSLLSVADDAGDGVGAVSARRRFVDGADGHGRDVVDPLRAADHGIDLRQQKN